MAVPPQLTCVWAACFNMGGPRLNTNTFQHSTLHAHRARPNENNVLMPIPQAIADKWSAQAARLCKHWPHSDITALSPCAAIQQHSSSHAPVCFLTFERRKHGRHVAGEQRVRLWSDGTQRCGREIRREEKRHRSTESKLVNGEKAAELPVLSSACYSLKATHTHTHTHTLLTGGVKEAVGQGGVVSVPPAGLAGGRRDAHVCTHAGGAWAQGQSTGLGGRGELNHHYNE